MHGFGKGGKLRKVEMMMQTKRKNISKNKLKAFGVVSIFVWLHRPLVDGINDKMVVINQTIKQGRQGRHFWTKDFRSFTKKLLNH